MSTLLMGAGVAADFWPGSLASLAAWYEADPEYCYTDGAAQFTAANSKYLSCADDRTLNPITAFSISLWFKTTGTGSDYMTLICKGTSNVSSQYLYRLILTGNGTTLHDGAPLNISGEIYNTANGLTLNTWTHVCSTWDGVTLKMYVNGVLHSTVAGTGALLSQFQDKNIFIGGGVGEYYNGCIDSPAIWDRAISLAEVATLYNSGNGKAYADLTADEKVNLVSFWNLNEASSTRSDSHGTNHLTDNNSVGLAAGIAQAQCGDGDPIALWTDRSGNAYNLTQTDPLKRPTLRLVSGKWCARFDGVNDWIDNTSDMSNGVPFTLACVGRYANTNAAEENFVDSPTQYHRTILGKLSSGALYGGPGGVNIRFAQDSGGLTPTSLVVDTNTHQYIGLCDGNSSLLRYDGTQIQTGTLEGKVFDVGIRLGNSFGSSPNQPLNGDIYTVLLYNADISAYFLQLEAYHRALYGTP